MTVVAGYSGEGAISLYHPLCAAKDERLQCADHRQAFAAAVVAHLVQVSRVAMARRDVARTTSRGAFLVAGITACYVKVARRLSCRGRGPLGTAQFVAQCGGSCCAPPHVFVFASKRCRRSSSGLHAYARSLWSLSVPLTPDWSRTTRRRAHLTRVSCCLPACSRLCRAWFALKEQSPVMRLAAGARGVR